MAVSIGELDAAVENWSIYLERLNHYFAANKEEDEQKKDAFLCCIGSMGVEYGGAEGLRPIPPPPPLLIVEGPPGVLIHFIKLLICAMI